MGARNDLQGLVNRALAWEGQVDSELHSLCTNIIESATGDPSREANRLAASVMVANIKLPTLQRAQCEAVLR